MVAIHFDVLSDSHAHHLNIQLSEPQFSIFERIKISSRGMMFNILC